MVNTKHDVRSYESTCRAGESDYKREIYDGNLLYESYLKAKKNSSWKSKVQKFEMSYLLELSRMQQELINKEYKFYPTTKFILHERGKTRPITGEEIQDRIVKHALCDGIINPAIKKYLIYDSGASVKGKGLKFTRERLLKHLRHYYITHGSNDGYILLIDFSKYYDNIVHQTLMDMFNKYIQDEYALWLLKESMKRSRIDVSYMDDDEYANCMNVLFNSLDYNKIDSELLTGEKYMDKHLNLGDQISQSSGILYRSPIDKYIKIVQGIKLYAAYNDDCYIIHESKEFLETLLIDIIKIADSLGITINIKKTRICKLSDTWKFLQIKYSLTETGRIIQKINPKRLTAMRKKMKKLAGVLSEFDFNIWFVSWFNNYYKLMSKKQRKNMNKLFEKLVEEAYHNV